MNAGTLLTRQQATLSICSGYRSHYQGGFTSSLLPTNDRIALTVKLINFCSTLWTNLMNPITETLRNLIIRFISGLDLFLSDFLLQPLRTPISKFCTPTNIARPSVIQQVTVKEVTVDPYLKALHRTITIHYSK
jgi:hypothetical protein